MFCPKESLSELGGGSQVRKNCPAKLLSQGLRNTVELLQYHWQSVSQPDASKPRGQGLQQQGLQLGTSDNGKMELKQCP